MIQYASLGVGVTMGITAFSIALRAIGF